MEIIICEKHGSQSFFEACEHYHIRIASHLVKILNLRVCVDCYKSYSFDRIDQLNIDEVLKLPKMEGDKIEKLLFKKYNSIKRKAICVKYYEKTKTKDLKPKSLLKTNRNNFSFH